mgnify:CR=1 FL=1
MRRLGLLLLSLIGCADERLPLEKEGLDIYYSSVSVCDCSKSAIDVLSALIEDEQQLYIDMFQELRMNCLTKFGTQLFTPTDCNDPDTIGELVDSLYTLGIDING